MIEQDSFDSNQEEESIHPKRFQYGKINGKQVGQGWLNSQGSTVKDYRANLFQALVKASENYKERLQKKGQPVPIVLQGNPHVKHKEHMQNLATVNPAIPNYSNERHPLHKFSGMCFKTQYQRFFTVDAQSFKYYQNEDGRQIKKTLGLEKATALIQEKTKFMDSQKKGQAMAGDQWAEPNNMYRVGIMLADREMKPVFFYTKSLHDAKVLWVNIQLYGDKYKAQTMTDRIELAWMIEKVTRFQKIITLMAFAKEKRFIAMYEFQQNAMQMVEIAQQSQEFRRQVVLKWFTSTLDDDEKPTLRASFRTANPKPWDKTKHIALSEQLINQHFRKLKTFIKNRKFHRQGEIGNEIQKQFKEETTGISIDHLQLDLLDDKGYNETILDVKHNQSSIIFDAEDSYKFMIIENKSLDRQGSGMASQAFRKKQAQNLIRKVKLEEVSFMATNLDQTTQFDYNNKLNKQVSYNIRLYGPIVRLGQIDPTEQAIAPSQLGFDVLRKQKPKFRISINNIKFPPQLAEQEDEKITLFVRLYQFDEASSENPKVFDCCSACIRIKDFKSGFVDAQQFDMYDGDSTVFNVDKLNDSPNERFGIGLTIRMIEKPLKLCTERFLDHEEVKSFEQPQPQYFSYQDTDKELSASMKDFQGNKFKVTFNVKKIHSSVQDIPCQERAGRRLLVGRYAIYQDKIVYVRQLSPQGQAEVIETFSKRIRNVQADHLNLVEQSGVNVFKLDKEPSLVQNSQYAWIMNLKVYDKRMLNSIQSKIQIRQTNQQFAKQDTDIMDDLSTIQGDMKISLVELKGLILPDEVNRRQQDLTIQIDPVVEVRLELMQGAVLQSASCDPIQNTREVIWGKQGNAKSLDAREEFNVNLGTVNHSGAIAGEQVKVTKTKKSTVIMKKKAPGRMADEEVAFIHIIVKNSIDGTEIGDAKIELDELIDVNLNDLAKEYCVCLNRSHILDEMLKAKAGQVTPTPNKTAKGDEKDPLNMYSQYSGIIRFQTLFQPTKDTRLRFKRARNTSFFKSPKQLLHFEYLLEKSDFDQFKYKIPQISFKANQRNFGENFINLPDLIRQSEQTPKIKSLLQKLQQGDQSKIMQQKLSDDIIKQIDQQIKFQSPFEKLYIILKLQRKERPFTEQIFFNFKNIWEIYTQIVKNQAFDTLNLNEWLSFIDEISVKHNFEKMDEMFQIAENQVDQQNDFDDDKSAMSASFVGNMVQEINKKAQDMRRVSEMKAREIEDEGGAGDRNFSLVLCSEWEKDGSQEFIDLVSLIKCGIPTQLRTAVWSDLTKTNMIEISEKKQMLKHFAKKYNKNLTVFENFQEISQKYDSVAFRQIDQDISDFKFPANYFEDVVDQSSAQIGFDASNKNLDGGPSSKGKVINRVNKIKHDKQQMRKLLRILLVWGKNVRCKSVDYQFCYPSGFLKVILRFVNLMTIEDAFWIIVGLIKQYPRLWCLQESSMLDDAKSNFRFEFTVLKAILEVNFNPVAQKLYQVGLPIETLVYDSMTSLYADFFHSDTVLRIWDLLIFYFNTSDQSSKRRGIWLLLAPALLIISMKQEQMLQAKTAKEIINIYNDGCGIDYNHNRIIQMLHQVIESVFVTEPAAGAVGAAVSNLNIGSLSYAESGGTGSGGVDAAKSTARGLLSGLFGLGAGAQVSGGATKVDEARKSLQTKQTAIFTDTRYQTQLVNDFLFKGGSKEKNDGMDFEQNDYDNGFGTQSQKPPSHQVLDYKSWRQVIIPSLQSQCLLNEEIIDDDLHEFETIDIYAKQNLDIKMIHVYLHQLDNFQASDESDQFRVQVQYGKLHPNGKFEVKLFSNAEDDECLKNSGHLQYFSNFKYSTGYNHIKVKIMNDAGKDKVSHCYADLRGYQRGKFIHLQRTMNEKSYTTSPQSEFALAQVKMSMFLESKKEKNADNFQADETSNKLAHLYSLTKVEPGRINIYKSQREQKFQKQMLSLLQNLAQNDYQNFKSYLKQEIVIDAMNHKYNYIEILPRQKFGHMTQKMFKEFVELCLPEHSNVASIDEIDLMYKGLMQRKQAEQTTPLIQVEATDRELTSKPALIDTDKVNDLSVNEALSIGEQIHKSEKDSRVVSIRSFIFATLLQSPLTVKEKLDCLYDIVDIGNKYVDGVDLHDVWMIYETILSRHLYYIPLNELRTQIENIYNGQVSGIIGAYWTKKFVSEIKSDMPKTDVTSLEDFLSQSGGQFSVIDVTKELQETFVMYQNLFGNKVIDFNEDTSPFKSFDNIFASTSRSDLGQMILSKTKSAMGKAAKNFRLCIISEIDKGEKITTEIRYDLDKGNIIVEDEKKADEDAKKFKKDFMKNINILDLSGNQRAIGKLDFMAMTQKIPFLYDLMRAETFWQDRKFDTQNKQNPSKIASLKMKSRFQPVVNIFLSDKDKIFIFKFENKLMGGRSDLTTIKELVPKQIFLFEIEALFLEDIILDMRDRIVNELTKMVYQRDIQLSDDFISDIEGKMEFYVRKVTRRENVATESMKGTEYDQIQSSIADNSKDLQWIWHDVNDFDRIEKFSDDEVFEDEVVFKLIKRKSTKEDIMDEKPEHIIQGYDCFSIYKHSDNSYEWRLCKIINKEIKPEFKTQGALNKFLGGGAAMNQIQDGASDQDKIMGAQHSFGQSLGFSVHESDQFFYYLEFHHLRDYGREMWVKRRREDVIFSSKYSRDQPSFETSCYKFIMELYRD